MEIQATAELNGFNIEDLLEYTKDSGDENPIHSDPLFFLHHPEYGALGFDTAVVPGGAVSKKLYLHVVPWLERKVGHSLRLTYFTCSFSKPLRFLEPVRFEWGREEEKNGIIPVRALAKRMDGGEISKYRLEFCKKRNQRSYDSFHLLYQAAGTVWKELGAVILQRATVQFEREIALEETMYTKICNELPPPKEKTGRIKLDLDAIVSNGGSEEMVAHYIIFCYRPHG